MGVYKKQSTDKREHATHFANMVPDERWELTETGLASWTLCVLAGVKGLNAGDEALCESVMLK